MAMCACGNSLAILEYLAEKFPNARLWPTDSAARALARAVSSEMHAGFLPLRRHMPMNMSRPVIKRDLTAEVAASVKRIETMWSECRARYGQKAEGRFCSEPSERPMPCTRRLLRVCILMGSM